MRIIKLFSIAFLLVCLTFGAIGCGDDDDQDEELAGELICDDGIDNDDDGDTDCDDIDCILASNCVPASCEDIFDAACQRDVDCGFATSEECIVALALVGIICENLESTATQECIDDIDAVSCDDIEMGAQLPESCENTLQFVGTCDECETDEDCPEPLFCFSCTFECTDNVNRCAPLGDFVECTDGIFKE